MLSNQPSQSEKAPKKPSIWGRREIVYPWIQIPLMLMIAGYGLFCACAVCFIAWLYLQGGTQNQISLVIVSFVVAGTLLLWSCLVFSNRILGPIYRLQLDLKRLAETGNIPEHFSVRRTDYLPELAASYSEVLSSLRKANQESSASGKSSNSDSDDKP